MAFEWPVFTRERLADGRSWSATFESYDQYREYFYFRVELFEGDVPSGAFVAKISSFAGDDWTIPAFRAEVLSQLGRVAAATVIVDGVVYDWYEVRYDGRDPVITIQSESGLVLELDKPNWVSLYARPGWWRGEPVMTTAGAERAVRIATRPGRDPAAKLSALEIDIVLYGPLTTLAEDLANATASIALADTGARSRFVQSWLSIGCTGATDRESRVAVDDWIASHADVLTTRGHLQAILDNYAATPLHPRTHAYWHRSALAFLAARCEPLGVALPLDTTRIDEEMAGHDASPPPAWGIPPSHDWW